MILVIIGFGRKYQLIVKPARSSELLSSCCNRDALAIAKPAADRLKFDDPVGQCKQGVILAATNIDARHNGGATLADQNGTSRYAFTAVGLHAEAFGIGVASVAG